MDSKMYVHIAEYLPLDTLSVFIDIFKKDIDSDEFNSFAQIRYHRSANIISRFIRRIYGISYNVVDLTKRFGFYYCSFSKKLMMRRFFFKKSKGCIGFWYINPFSRRNIRILSKYHRKNIQSHEVTRWDLWELQKQMTYADILNME